jgi:hypothetical protein
MRVDPNAVRMVTKPALSSRDRSDDDRFRTQRISPHGIQNRVGRFRRHDSHHFSFAGRRTADRGLAIRKRVPKPEPSPATSHPTEELLLPRNEGHLRI